MRRTLSMVIKLGLGLTGSLLSASDALAASCSYDAVLHRVTVSVTGDSPTISVSSGGAVQLNNVACGAATVSNTALIYIGGGAGNDRPTISLTYPFTPGFEDASGPGDVAEIDFTVDLGGGSNALTLSGGADPDHLVLGTTGINLTGDDDSDVAIIGSLAMELRGNSGADYLSAAGGFGTGDPVSFAVTLNGGNGDDELHGGGGADNLLGGNDKDSMYGNSGADVLNGGNGDDIEDGGPGNDRFTEGSLINGNDIFIGGEGTDQVSYANRTNPLVVSIDDIDDDGDIYGELDNVGSDIENVQGGLNEDVLIGSAGRNELSGLDGQDWIEGGGGIDTIYGGNGEDFLFGQEGNDTLVGGNGVDYLFGGNGIDTLNGGDGDDYFNGGDGTDVMQCGLGLDTVTSRDETVGADCENF